MKARSITQVMNQAVDRGLDEDGAVAYVRERLNVPKVSNRRLRAIYQMLRAATENVP